MSARVGGLFATLGEKPVPNAFSPRSMMSHLADTGLLIACGQSCLRVRGSAHASVSLVVCERPVQTARLGGWPAGGQSSRHWWRSGTARPATTSVFRNARSTPCPQVRLLQRVLGLLHQAEHAVAVCAQLARNGSAKRVNSAFSPMKEALGPLGQPRFQDSCGTLPRARSHRGLTAPSRPASALRSRLGLTGELDHALAEHDRGVPANKADALHLVQTARTIERPLKSCGHNGADRVSIRHHRARVDGGCIRA